MSVCACACALGLACSGRQLPGGSVAISNDVTVGQATTTGVIMRVRVTINAWRPRAWGAAGLVMHDVHSIDYHCASSCMSACSVTSV